jgi:chromosomal replication initiator protein
MFTQVKMVGGTEFANAIIKEVGIYFNIPHEDFLRRTRQRKFLIPRQIAIYFIRNKTTLGLADIGLLLGGYDHTSIMHTMDVVSDMIDTQDEKYYPHIKQLENLIKFTSYDCTRIKEVRRKV